MRDRNHSRVGFVRVITWYVKGETKMCNTKSMGNIFHVLYTLILTHTESMALLIYLRLFVFFYSLFKKNKTHRRWSMGSSIVSRSLFFLEERQRYLPKVLLPSFIAETVASCSVSISLRRDDTCSVVVATVRREFQKKMSFFACFIRKYV